MTAPLSPSDLAEIEAVAKAATPGPWEVYDPNEGMWPPRPHYCVANDEFHNPTDSDEDAWIAVDISVNTGTAADAAHIARMDPATTLALLAWGKRAEDALARVREVHVESSGGDPYGDYIDHRACRHCRKAWPCPTVAALDADAAAGGAG